LVAGVAFENEIPSEPISRPLHFHAYDVVGIEALDANIVKQEFHVVRSIISTLIRDVGPRRVDYDQVGGLAISDWLVEEAVDEGTEAV